MTFATLTVLGPLISVTEPWEVWLFASEDRRDLLVGVRDPLDWVCRALGRGGGLGLWYDIRTDGLNSHI
jgi:hypothetical protein